MRTLICTFVTIYFVVCFYAAIYTILSGPPEANNNFKDIVIFQCKKFRSSLPLERCFLHSWSLWQSVCDNFDIFKWQCTSTQRVKKGFKILKSYVYESPRNTNQLHFGKKTWHNVCMCKLNIIWYLEFLCSKNARGKLSLLPCGPATYILKETYMLFQISSCWKQDATILWGKFCSWLLTILNNIGQFCLAWIWCNNAEQYCWQVWTILPQQHCCILFSTTIFLAI